MQVRSIPFSKVTWASPIKRRQFFVQYAKENGFDYLSAEAWYSQPIQKFLSTSGSASVLVYHNKSVTNALLDLFPDIGLDRRRFISNKWHIRKDRRAFFENYALENGFDFLSPIAWYSQTIGNVISFAGGKGILYFYKNNIAEALIDLFPEIGLEKSRFETMNWVSPSKRKQFFENYAKANGFDYLSPAAWYSQSTTKILSTKGAGSVVLYHKNSVARALTDLFPNIGLERNGFTSRKFYSRKDRRDFFESYARENGFDYLSPNAWYSQTYSKIFSYKRAKGILYHYKNNVAEALADLFTEISLDKSKFKSSLMQESFMPLKNDVIHQGHLGQVVRDLFLSENVVYNSRKKSHVTNPNTSTFFEIDVWIPKLQLGFEFQDTYHYMNTWYIQRSLDAIQQRDKSKVNAANSAGITLVQVPCWWDGTPSSLVATIQQMRPDLLLDINHSAEPISLNPDFNFFDIEGVPGIGVLMLASFPLNQNFNQSILCKTWWMGEKYDGVRCCWNPDQRAAYTRSGREIPLLEAFAITLPNIFIDGEFWFGRGLFSLIYPLLHGDASWHACRMISFDSPHRSFHHLPFEQRYNFLLESILFDHPINIVPQRMLCEDSSQLNNLNEKIIDHGGEGIILRRVASRYHQGRNKYLIKLKSSYGDTEGLVAHVDNSAITLKLPSGQLFKVPIENVHVIYPPLKVGEVVTFSYEKLSRRELPVHAEIFRRRTDLKWEDVVSNSQSHHVQENATEDSPSDNFTTKPRGFWNLENMREYLANFAKNRNLDPHVPSAWNRIPVSSISDTKGGKIILQKFKDPATALTALFPDVGLDKFKSNSHKWHSSKNRRMLFENYARENGFDSLSPAAWYSQKFFDVLSFKGVAGVVKHHNHSLVKTLVDLFPEIGLEKRRFKSWT